MTNDQQDVEKERQISVGKLDYFEIDNLKMQLFETDLCVLVLTRLPGVRAILSRWFRIFESQSNLHEQRRNGQFCWSDLS